MRLLTLLNDPEVSLQKVADIATRDVGITASFLRMANSPLFGLRGRVGTVMNAVRVIGMVHARLLVLSSGVSQIAQREMTSYGLPAGAFMRHSELVANLTMTIAHDYRYPNIGLAYTAGLLHDIGKVILNSHAQRQQPAVSFEEYMIAHSCSLTEAEQQISGSSHVDLGRQLATLWSLPDEIVNAVALHHTVEEGQEELFLSLCVRLANQLACLLDPEYPLFHRPIPMPSPEWLNMESVMAMARDCGFDPSVLESPPVLPG